MNEDLMTYIQTCTQKSGYPPTYDEIADRFGLSRTTAWRRVRKLIDDGLVEQAPGMRRTLHVRSVMKTEGHTL